MENYSHILAAVDFGEQTESVLDRAIAEARHNSATLTVLYVVEHDWPTDIDVMPPSFDEMEEQLVDRAMQRLEAVTRAHGEYPIEPVVVAGRPIQEVTRVGAGRNVDLIVVGSHGRHGLRGILGSTTDRIAHQAECDVLIVRRRSS